MERQTTLITGANRGIGLEVTRRFSDAGWHVIACCREPFRAKELTALAEAADGRIEILPLNVTDEASVRALEATIKGRKIDVLLNNAGIIGGDHQSAFDMNYDVWLETLKVNTIAPFRMAEALIDNLRLSGDPRIVNISSQMGALSRRSSGSYAYRSSKAALNKVMQVLAEDLRSENIIVSLVHPGWVRTDMGGPSADISVVESGEGIFSLITKLQMADSGKFFKWNGEEHRW